MKVNLTETLHDALNDDHPNWNVSWVEFMLSGNTHPQNELEVTVLESPNEDLIVRFEKCDNANFVWVQSPESSEIFLSSDILEDKELECSTHDSYDGKGKVWLARLSPSARRMCRVIKDDGVLVINLS